LKILIIDNYDSFTYNLFHMVEQAMPAGHKPVVKRNDEISLSEAGKYDKIIISPGPGLPRDAGISKAVIVRYAPTKSILGVCLGHQAIGEAFGAGLINLQQVLHGKAIQTIVTKSDELLFAGCPEQFETGRYHSWVIDPDSMPEVLEVTAIDENKRIMAIRHRQYDVRGVQFHPESVMTSVGQQILHNWTCS
jgi:anthranilate synthase component II